MQGLRRPNGAIIQREIQYLTRAFPPRAVTIYREILTLSTLGQRRVSHPNRTVIFTGEALYIPAGGVVQLFGGGQVERTSPTLIVVGNRDIRQGDFVVIDGRTYLVEDPRNPQGAYVECGLQQYRQGGA